MCELIKGSFSAGSQSPMLSQNKAPQRRRTNISIYLNNMKHLIKCENKSKIQIQKATVGSYKTTKLKCVPEMIIQNQNNCLRKSKELPDLRSRKINILPFKLKEKSKNQRIKTK